MRVWLARVIIRRIPTKLGKRGIAGKPYSENIKSGDDNGAFAWRYIINGNAGSNIYMAIVRNIYRSRYLVAKLAGGMAKSPASMWGEKMYYRS